MTSTFRRLGPSELLPRYIFAEHLLVRRRVLEVGAVASTQGASAQFLIQRGARWVMATDDDAAAVDEAQRRLGTNQLRFRANVFDDLEPHSFDLVLVADLARYAFAPKLLEEIARLVAKTGYLVGGLRNPAGLALAQLMDPDAAELPPTYGQVLDALSPHFASVEVATQSPVLGYQLAFERGEGLQVDGSLAGAGEAAYFVLIAGQEAFRQFEPTWVQLAPEPLAYTGGKLEEYAQRTRTWEERTGKLKESLIKVRGELEDRDEKVKKLSQELERARTDAARLSAHVETLRSPPEVERGQDELTSRIRRSEAELQVSKERAQDAEERLARHREEVEAAIRAQKTGAAEVLAAQESVRLERARREEMAALLEDARARLSGSYEELRLAKDEAAASAVERDRARLAAERAEERSRSVGREVDVARQREIRLAEAQSTALTAVEALQAELAKLKTESQARADELQLKDAELERALRSAQADNQLSAQARETLQQYRAQLDLAQKERDDERSAFETERTAAKGEKERALAKQAELAEQLATSQALAISLEERLSATREEFSGAGARAADLEAELEVARARSQRLERDISTAVAAERSSREQAQAALEAAERELAEARSDARGLREQVPELERALAEVRETMAVAEAASKANAGELQQLRAEHDAAVHEHAAKLERHQAERGDLERTLSERLERLQAESTDALSRLTSERDALKAEVEGARARAEVAQAELEQFHHAQRELAADLESARAAAGSGKERVATLEARLIEVEAEREAQRKRAEELEGELSGTRTDVEGHATRLGELTDSLAKAERELQDARRDLDEARAAGLSTSEARTREAAESAERISKLEADLASATETRETQARDYEGRLETVRRELEERSGSEIGDLEARVVVLEARRGDAESERDRLKFELAGVKAGIERLHGELASAHQALEAGKEAKSEADADALRYKVHLRELEEKLAAAQGVAQVVDTELPALKEQLESATAENNLLNDERERLVGEIERLEAAKGELAARAEKAPELEAKLKAVEAQRAQATEREAKLNAQLVERTSKFENAQRRLTAQDTELQALRRAVSRQAPGGVQQIYERASAELSAVKEQIHRRPSGVFPAPPAAKPATPPQGVPDANLERTLTNRIVPRDLNELIAATQPGAPTPSAPRQPPPPPPPAVAPPASLPTSPGSPPLGPPVPLGAEEDDVIVGVEVVDEPLILADPEVPELGEEEVTRPVIPKPKP